MVRRQRQWSFAAALAGMLVAVSVKEHDFLWVRAEFQHEECTPVFQRNVTQQLLNLLQAPNANCSSSARAVCTTPVKTSELFGAAVGRNACEECFQQKKTINATLHLDAPQNFGSNQSKCRLGIASCSDFVATWQAACFDSRDECASAVLSKCQMTSKGDKYPFNPKNQSRRRIAANRLLLDRAGTKLFAMVGLVLRSE